MTALVCVLAALVLLGTAGGYYAGRWRAQRAFTLALFAEAARAAQHAAGADPPADDVLAPSGALALPPTLPEGSRELLRIWLDPQGSVHGSALRGLEPTDEADVEPTAVVLAIIVGVLIGGDGRWHASEPMAQPFARRLCARLRQLLREDIGEDGDCSPERWN